MIRKLLTLTVISVTCLLQTKSQNISFGKVSPKDFSTAALQVDTSKGAVIISDVGVTTFEGNNKSWFTMVFKRKRRILILNKNAFDLAKVEIQLYKKDNSEEIVDKLKGSTYNLVDGVVVETKLSSDAIFKDKYDRNHIIQKFSMPAVKEGSIIEYTYTINSDFLFNLQPWEFQGEYPRVWSEYSVSIPDFFDYVLIAKGFVNFDLSEHPTRFSNYNVNLTGGTERGELVRLEATVTDHHWVTKNVPALTVEKYTSTIDNYTSKVDFQLAGYRFKDQPYHTVMDNWTTVGEKLLNNEDFGVALNKNNNWLDDEMKNITASVTGKTQKARAIFYYVKNNIKCTNTKGIFTTKSLKDVFKSRSGTLAEVNLLLVAMMNHENIHSDPVILSTRAHGQVSEYYPLLDQYNYVICKSWIDTNTYYLDASQPYLGFDHLPAYVYNGLARTITATPEAIDISADNLQEIKTTNVLLFNDEKIPGKWEGTYKSQLGFNESYIAREKMSTKGKADFEKALKRGDYKIADIEYNDLDSLEKPLVINYNLSMGEGGNDMIYFSPMLMESYTTNPFQSAERRYPVEMPYKIDETYFLTMEIPAGYEVDEMPKQTKALFNDNEGLFEYLISSSGEQINMRCHIKFEKATFNPEDYEGLRNFYSLIVKKESEQIVLKKKKARP